MTAIDAIAIYEAGGPGALRLAVRGGVQQRKREGRVEAIVTEIAVPVVRLAESLRLRGLKQEANDVLAHAVHDGVDPSLLAEAVGLDTQATISTSVSPIVTVGPNGELSTGPPAPATDAASTQALANYLRDRLLVY